MPFFTTEDNDDGSNSSMCNSEGSSSSNNNSGGRCSIELTNASSSSTSSTSYSSSSPLHASFSSLPSSSPLSILSPRPKRSGTTTSSSLAVGLSVAAADHSPLDRDDVPMICKVNDSHHHQQQRGKGKKQHLDKKSNNNSKSNSTTWWLCVIGCAVFIMMSLTQSNTTSFLFYNGGGGNNSNSNSNSARRSDSASSMAADVTRSSSLRQKQQVPPNNNAITATTPVVSITNEGSLDSEYITYELIKDTAITTTPSNGNKTLVIVFGSLRGGEIAWESLYNNVLNTNQADLAIMVGDNIPKEYHNASIWERSKYTWLIKEFDDWSYAIDIMVKKLELERQQQQQEDGDVFTLNSNNWRSFIGNYTKQQLEMKQQGKRIASIFGGMKGYDGSGGVVFMMRWFLSQQLVKYRLHDKYDKFIITRTDHYYLCNHDMKDLLLGDNDNNNDDDRLWIPRGEKYHGITDRHLVVSKTNVLKALDIYPPLFQNPYKFLIMKQIEGENNNNNNYNDDNDQEGTILLANPETFLRYVWDYHQLKYSSFGRSMFLVSQPNIDQTRWTHSGSHESSSKHDDSLVMVRDVTGKHKTVPIHYKYAQEYKQATRYCRKQKPPKDSEVTKH